MKKHVSRACGGSMCAKWVCDRIKLTFLNENPGQSVKGTSAESESLKKKKKAFMSNKKKKTLKDLFYLKKKESNYAK